MVTNPARPSSPHSHGENPTSSLSLQYGGSLMSSKSSMVELAKACGIQNVSLSSTPYLMDSQRSNITSEMGYHSSKASLQSYTSIKSDASIQSQVSTASQPSMQSDFSLLSQSSLGFLPSLERVISDGKLDVGSADYRCLATLEGHDGHVSSLALAAEHLYSGSGSHDIRIWSKANLAESCNFGSGDGAVKALVIAEDRVFSAHQDHKVRVWKRSKNSSTGHKLIATMPTVRDYMMRFIPLKNYVQIRRHHKRLWIEHVDTISVLAAGKNDLLYSASWDRTVKVWRLSDFKCLESFKAHDDAINALVVSDDGYVYTGSADAKIRVWVKQAGEKNHTLVTTMENHKSAVNALALSPDGSLIYSGACDRAIIVWDREDSAQHVSAAGALRGHRHAILCLSTVGEMLCSGSADKTIRVWRRGAGGRLHGCVAVLRGHGGPVKCVTMRMDKETMECVVYSGSLDGDIKVWGVCLKRGNMGLQTCVSKDEGSTLQSIKHAFQSSRECRNHQP